VKFFVLTYRRATKKLVSVEEFDDGSEALDRRMAIERDTSHTDDTEVVLLLARDEKHLRQTHSRYFRTARQLFQAASEVALA
jgi:hypothetical protein